MRSLKELYSVLVILTLYQWDFISARGCFNDPKVYIIKLTHSQQHGLIMAALDDCVARIQSEASLNTTDHTEKYCHATFDNIMCWPRTRAGTTLEQDCPNYINNFDTRAKARRRCLPDGTWYIHPETNSTYTDFTACASADTEDDTRDNHFDHLPTIKRLYMTGYSVSLAALLVAIILMLWCRRLHCQRNAIHINLFVSFVLRSLICLIKESFHTPEGSSTVINNTATLTTSGSNWSCKLVFSVFNYIIVANYTWIFIEGLYLHNLIFITTFKKSKRFYIYILFGWCSPVLCVVPWVIVRRYLEDTLCWSTHSADNKFVWIIRGPIVFTVVINFLFFLNIIRVLFTKLTAVHMSDPHRYRKLARSTLVLIPLFGVYYMISVVMPECMDPGLELVWLYVESGVNSFQGLIVAILFCFCNGEVQHEIRKKWNRRWALRRLSTFSTRSTRTLSLGSTVFVKDKPIPSAMFSDVTINVNVDDKQCHLDLDELKRDDKVTNNNIVDGTRTEKTPSEDENDTLL
ncbi:secretin receptor-like [Crassostrea virginica]